MGCINDYKLLYDIDQFQSRSQAALYNLFLAMWSQLLWFDNPPAYWYDTSYVQSYKIK